MPIWFLQVNQGNSISFLNLTSSMNMSIETTGHSDCLNFDYLAENVIALNGSYTCKSDYIAPDFRIVETSKPSMAAGEKIGIGIGIPLLLLVLISTIFAVTRFKRARAKFPTGGVELPVGGHHERTEMPTGHERWELKVEERPGELEARNWDWAPTTETQELDT